MPYSEHFFLVKSRRYSVVSVDIPYSVPQIGMLQQTCTASHDDSRRPRSQALELRPCFSVVAQFLNRTTGGDGVWFHVIFDHFLWAPSYGWYSHLTMRYVPYIKKHHIYVEFEVDAYILSLMLKHFQILQKKLNNNQSTNHGNIPSTNTVGSGRSSFSFLLHEILFKRNLQQVVPKKKMKSHKQALQAVRN